ncbi:MAG: trypsin-like peptidase domain-containing protein [Gemmatimonadaceae bacterium]
MTKPNLRQANVLTAALTLAACLSPAGFGTHQPATLWVEMLATPAIVRVVAGHSARWRWHGKVYDVALVYTGSGFFVDPQGYVLTNAHVVQPIKDGDDLAREALLQVAVSQVAEESSLKTTPSNLARLEKALKKEGTIENFQRENHVVLQSGAMLRYEIKAYGAPLAEGQDLIVGKDVAVLKVETRNAPTLGLGDSDKVAAGATIRVLGYPGAAELHGLGKAYSTLEPTVTRGQVSARKESADGIVFLQTDAAVSGGSSGGPALNEDGQVVGLLTFGSSRTQGFNFLVPSNTVREFLRQAGAQERSGATDELWRQGVALLEAHSNAKAKARFEDVLALFPDHAQARTALRDAQERLLSEPEPTRPYLGRAWALAAAAAALGALLLLRRKTWSVSRAERQVKRTEVFGAARPHILVCVSGSREGASFPIGVGLTLGRGPEVDVALEDAQVSARHAWVGPVGDRIVLRDLGSTNGTFLNSDLLRRVTEIQLNGGDEVILGLAARVRFKYQASSA